MSDALGGSPASMILSFLFLWPILGFAISRILKRNDVADLLWGTGIAGVCWMVALPNWDFLSGVQRMILAMTTLWGLRLTLHLAVRNLPRSEDARYVDMRNAWGEQEPRRAFTRVFLLQSVLAVLVATAAWWKLRNPFLLGDHLTRGDRIAYLIASLGLLMEAVADFALLRHQGDSSRRGKPLRHGLWAWSRHPNYFGETLFWWGIALLGLRRPEDGVALLGASLITWLLLRISGVPLLDAKLRSRSPEFLAYFEDVSPFIPMPSALWRWLRGKKGTAQGG